MSVDLRAIREEAKSGVVELSGDAALRMVAVCEAANKWAEWHGESHPAIVPMMRPVRELHQAVRALGEGEGGEKR